MGNSSSVVMTMHHTLVTSGGFPRQSRRISAYEVETEVMEDHGHFRFDPKRKSADLRLFHRLIKVR
jgi:hypothetical protein